MGGHQNPTEASNFIKIKLKQHQTPKNSHISLNHNYYELSGDDGTQPHPQQGQQNTDQSPSPSTQTTPLVSKVTALKSVEPIK